MPARNNEVLPSSFHEPDLNDLAIWYAAFGPPSRGDFIESRKAAPTKLPTFENMAGAAEVRQIRARLPLEIENVLLSRQQRGKDANDCEKPAPSRT